MTAGEVPRSRLRLVAQSVADDLSYIALADASTLLREMAPAVSTRLIGGLMMSFHAERWDLGAGFIRETQDADFGAPLLAVRVFEDLETALEEIGYEHREQYRYVRQVSDLPIEVGGYKGEYEAILDLVQVRAIPAGGAPVVPEGSGELDPTAIVEALNRGPIPVDLELSRLNGHELLFQVDLADEASALMLKAYSWRSRKSQRDAIDLGRALEVAVAARCAAVDFSSDVGKEAAQIIHQALEDPEGAAVRAWASFRGTSVDGAHTRILALLQRVFDQ